MYINMYIYIWNASNVCRFCCVASCLEYVLVNATRLGS